MSVADDLMPLAAAPAAASAEVLVRAEAASAGFAGRPVIEAITLEVRAGETVVVVGRSGAGKTTLLHLLAGLIPARDGTVVAEPAALMPQRDGLMPWASAQTNAALPLRIAGMPRKEARLLAAGQLRALGLGNATGQAVATLSGGMRQRVALARTLLTGRRLLLLDEPLASVDALTREELHGVLLAHLARDGHGAVLVTHDLDEAVRLGDRVLVLSGGQNDRSTNGPATLSAGPTLAGRPGEPLSARGGDSLRAALLEALGT